MKGSRRNSRRAAHATAAVRLSTDDRAALLELRRVVQSRACFRTRDEGGPFWDEIVRAFRPSEVERRRSLPPLDPADGPIVPIAVNVYGDVLALALEGPKRGQVLFVNHEYNPGQRYRVIKVAPSLRAFIRGLRAASEVESEEPPARSDEEFAALLDAIAANPNDIDGAIRRATQPVKRKQPRK